jgi:hypothetical protein
MLLTVLHTAAKSVADLEISKMGEGALQKGGPTPSKKQKHSRIFGLKS